MATDLEKDAKKQWEAAKPEDREGVLEPLLEIVRHLKARRDVYTKQMASSADKKLLNAFDRRQNAAQAALILLGYEGDI